ncbi:hypothetical protein [Rossellomorea sp. RS05]|uniref:hypothetical protein n=1 Tax=Rossellomorea sp. RS05 TaxID=3149166 RepID=UPI001C45E3BD|nr:hypothetical protein [Bacillus sp. JRC01]
MITFSLMVWYEAPLWLVILLPIAVGTCPSINSLLIVKIGIPELLATLRTINIITCFDRTHTGGYSIYSVPSSGQPSSV